MRFVQFTSGRGQCHKQVAIPVEEVCRLETAPTRAPATVVRFRDGSSLTVNLPIEAVTAALQPLARPGPSLVADLYRERARAIELAIGTVTACAMTFGKPWPQALIEARHDLERLRTQVLAGYWPANGAGANAQGTGSIGPIVGGSTEEGADHAASA